MIWFRCKHLAEAYSYQARQFLGRVLGRRGEFRFLWLPYPYSRREEGVKAVPVILWAPVFSSAQAAIEVIRQEKAKDAWARARYGPLWDRRN